MDPTVLAAIIVAVPAAIGAYASLRTRNDVKTNHGKKIGEHVEDLVDWADAFTAWAWHHQENDDRVAQYLGVPPAPPGPRLPQPLVDRDEHAS